MHHNLAVNDFSEAKFQIYRFPAVTGSDNKDRSVRVYEFDTAELLSEEDINEAINVTYRIWHEVLDERREEARRAASSGTGGLF
jgi:hypothetical protein